MDLDSGSYGGKGVYVPKGQFTQKNLIFFCPIFLTQIYFSQKFFFCSSEIIFFVQFFYLFRKYGKKTRFLTDIKKKRMLKYICRFVRLNCLTL